MLNSIYELRTRLDEGYHISLSIPSEEYESVYGKTINENNAKEIIHNYLQRRDDDGDPYNVKIYNHDDSNLIEIEANLSYLGNEHKDYDTHVEGNGIVTNFNKS